MASLDGTYVPKKTRHDKVIKTFGCFFSSISITQSIREKKKRWNLITRVEKVHLINVCTKMEMISD